MRYLESQLLLLIRAIIINEYGPLWSVVVHCVKLLSFPGLGPSSVVVVEGLLWVCWVRIFVTEPKKEPRGKAQISTM